MSLFDWKKRLGMEASARSAHFVMPTLALDLEPHFVVGARLDASSMQVQRVGVRQLAVGVLEPSPNKPNVTDADAIRETVEGVAALLGNPGGKIGLLIPDVAARVAVLQFDGLPDSQREAESLIQWRMREFLPFPPEEARFSYQVMARDPARVEVLGMAVRRSVLAEYEAALGGINGGPALVLPASVALLPLLPDGSSGQLLLHLCPGALTAVVVATDRVRYWRTRPLEAKSDPESREEVAREAARVLATCQDHLSLQVENIWFCSRPPAAPEMQEALAKTLGRELGVLPRGRAPATRLPPGEQAAFEDFGMPFAGLAANRGESR